MTPPDARRSARARSTVSMSVWYINTSLRTIASNGRAGGDEMSPVSNRTCDSPRSFTRSVPCQCARRSDIANTARRVSPNT
jgi:hypothetical protein